MREKNYFNLVPVFGTCLFIYYGNQANALNKIYKNKFLSNIGLISYSLYLWHQPILAYFKNLFNNNIPNYYYLIIFFLIYFFSFISFYFVEKPFYEKKILKNRQFLLFIFLLILLIIYSGFLISTGKINVSNTTNLKVENIQKKYPKLALRDLAQKQEDIINNLFKRKFENQGRIKVFINGDFHSRDLFLILHSSKKISKIYEFSFYGFDDADVIIYTYQFYEEMLKNFDQNDLFIKAKAKNKKIIIVGRAAEFYTGNIDPLNFNLIQDLKILVHTQIITRI